MTNRNRGAPRIGQVVILKDLVRRTDLNGQRAFVEGVDPDGRLVLVLTSNHTAVRANECNVVVADTQIP